jgi:hypothetical protein
MKIIIRVETIADWGETETVELWPAPCLLIRPLRPTSRQAEGDEIP